MIDVDTLSRLHSNEDLTKENLINKIHEDEVKHRGITATLYELKKIKSWTRIRDDIKEFI